MNTDPQPPESGPSNDEPASGGSHLRLVRLIQCGRRACGHVLFESEWEWIPSKLWEGSKTAGCPKCGETSFYALNEHGQKVTMREHDKYRYGIDPTTIVPAARMGTKMKRRILAARRRAIEANDKDEGRRTLDLSNTNSNL